MSGSKLSLADWLLSTLFPTNALDDGEMKADVVPNVDNSGRANISFMVRIFVYFCYFLQQLMPLCSDGLFY